MTTVTTTVEVVNLKETIRALRRLDPELAKQFRADVRAVAAPAVQAAKDAYPAQFLSGMDRRWRHIYPMSANSARSGVRVQFDTRRNAIGVILVTQADAGAAVFETAGRRSSNPLGTSLDKKAAERGWAEASAGRTRVMGRAVYRARAAITEKLERVVRDAVATVQADV